MELRACVECRRHVAVGELACPFCGASSSAESSAPTRLGRLSRAAVFAGAALATTACGGKKPKAEQTIDNTQKASETADAGVEPTTTTEPDHSNIPMPYGAPPARRRVV